MKLPVADTKTARRRLAHLVMEHRAQVALVLTLQTLASLSVVSIPTLVGVMIDVVRAGADKTWILTLLGITAGMVILASVFTWLANYRARVFGELIFHRLRVDLVKALTHLPLSTVESAGAGDLLARTSHDLRSVSHVVRNGMSALLSVTITFIATVGMAMTTSWPLGLTMLVGLPVIVLALRWYYPRVVPAYQAVAHNQSVVSGLMSESLDQAETVDTMRLGPIRRGRIDTLLVEKWRVERYTAAMRVLLFIVLVFFTLTPLLAIIAVGVWLMPSGAVTAGQITAVALLGYQMRGPVWEATFWLDELQFAMVSLRRIFGVSTVTPDRTVRASGIQPGPITATNVCYEYEAGRPVLHNLDLQLRPGERLAIVGPSGAGKSTFGRMLAGIHPPTSGTVTINGVPLVDLPEDELRRHTVLVTQEHHVFVGTLADNLRLALPKDVTATDQELLDALAAVGAGSWVGSLEHGIDTKVGAGGVELSPSQAQQLALARIIVMDPHTLVLDEATSLIDASDAENVERSLGALLAGRTVVAIAHRLHTAHDADRVAVMVDGRIVELGSHDDLVSRGGVYADLWEKWNRR